MLKELSDKELRNDNIYKHGKFIDHIWSSI